ncbi:MAG: hypothetical protein VXZ39_07925, partial [Planctomycetota bacterium]|nr:hypothetical protein [Planctomycetota bacterium]
MSDVPEEAARHDEHPFLRPVAESTSGAPAAGIGEIVRAAAEQEARQVPGWEGTLHEYLELVDQRPALARNAWQRMADMIESHGVTRPELPGGVPRWQIFDDPFGAAAAGLGEGAAGPDAIFGLDQSLHDLVMTIRAGARGLGPERRIVLLHGPVGSAKSTIARILKRGLEHYTRTDEGAIYTFDWHVDGEVIPSPMNQDPLLLVPESARPRIQSRLREIAPREDEISIQGELDPVSRFWLSELMARYEGS